MSTSRRGEEAPAVWHDPSRPPHVLRLGSPSSTSAVVADRLASSFKLEFLPFAEVEESAQNGRLDTCDAVLVDLAPGLGDDQRRPMAEALQALRRHTPAIRAVVMADPCERDSARLALAAGAWTVVAPDPPLVEARLRSAAWLCQHHHGGERGAGEASSFAGRADGHLLLGAGEAIRAVRRAIDQVAPTDVPVLITGESGTGKELAAEAIHARSRRAKGPFVPINCGAIPPGLLEAELFGSERGAFTGATSSRVGRIRAAAGGTLFLDEVGELAPPLQSKLLRFLQEHTVEPVGGRGQIPVDVRVLAATNRDLDASLRSGAFREDLFYRLAVFRIHMPRLVDRDEDIGLLARHFLHRFGSDRAAPDLDLGPDALTAMRAAPWPGNVRELINRIRRALVVAEGPHITAADLGLGPRRARRVRPLREVRGEAEARCIEEALRRQGWRKRETAKALGISRTRLYELMRGYGIPDRLPRRESR